MDIIEHDIIHPEQLINLKFLKKKPIFRFLQDMFSNSLNGVKNFIEI